MCWRWRCVDAGDVLVIVLVLVSVSVLVFLILFADASGCGCCDRGFLNAGNGSKFDEDVAGGGDCGASS